MIHRAPNHYVGGQPVFAHGSVVTSYAGLIAVVDASCLGSKAQRIESVLLTDGFRRPECQTSVGRRRPYAYLRFGARRTERGLYVCHRAAVRTLGDNHNILIIVRQDYGNPGRYNQRCVAAVGFLHARTGAVGEIVAGLVNLDGNLYLSLGNVFINFADECADKSFGRRVFARSRIGGAVNLYAHLVGVGILTFHLKLRAWHCHRRYFERQLRNGHYFEPRFEGVRHKVDTVVGEVFPDKSDDFGFMFVVTFRSLPQQVAAGDSARVGLVCVKERGRLFPLCRPHSPLGSAAGCHVQGCLHVCGPAVGDHLGSRIVNEVAQVGIERRRLLADGDYLLIVGYGCRHVGAQDCYGAVGELLYACAELFSAPFVGVGGEGQRRRVNTVIAPRCTVVD